MTTVRYTNIVKQNKAREWVAYVTWNGETIFWSEGYAKKESAVNALRAYHNSVQGTEFSVEILSENKSK